MRWRGAKVFSSTLFDSSAVSSSSSKANNGTCFNTSGLHDMNHPSGMNKIKSSVKRRLMMSYIQHSESESLAHRRKVPNYEDSYQFDGRRRADARHGIRSGCSQGGCSGSSGCFRHQGSQG